MKMRRAKKTKERNRECGHNSHLYTFNGETKSITAWARHFGVVSPHVAMDRIKKLHMDVYKALTTPLIPQSERNQKSPLRIYCEEHNLPWKFIYDRIRRGMSVEDAITLPKIGTASPYHKRAIHVKIDGETVNLAEACRRTGVDPSLARIRYRKCGWSAEAATMIPSKGLRTGCTSEESEKRERNRVVADRRRQLASMGIII